MPQIIKFLVVGGSVTAVQFILLIIGIELLNLSAIVASGLSYSLAALVSYTANYRFTFQSNSNHWQAFPKFCGSVAIGLLANTLLFSGAFYLLTEHAPPGYLQPYVIAQVVATGITTFINYLISRLWVYR